MELKKILSSAFDYEAQAIKDMEKLVEQLNPVHAALMPDAHVGYGAPIGSVFALERRVTPSGVGYDIGCGVAVFKVSGVNPDLIVKRREEIANAIQTPMGVGKGSHVVQNEAEFEEIVHTGLAWAVKNGYIPAEDRRFTEDNGSFYVPDSFVIPARAKERGLPQVGSLGAGNHFIEFARVTQVFDEEAADAWGVNLGDVLFWIHTGSRGYGHELASIYSEQAAEYVIRNNFDVDLNLAFLPTDSPTGQDYISAMYSAANFAYVNRSLIKHDIERAIKSVLKDAEVTKVYEITHNMAKEEHHLGQDLIVHRKGATRAFGHHRMKNTDYPYAQYGQPVLIPGSMGTRSYILRAIDSTQNRLVLSSSAHGAGRALSRNAAKKKYTYQDVLAQLSARDILVVSNSQKGVREEAPGAYKNIDEVVRTISAHNIAHPVLHSSPFLVLKG